MKTKKIGTLSLNINAPDFNYGAMLHSWAFQQYLLKHDHIEAEIIDYTMPKIEGWNRYNPKKSSINYCGPRKISGTREHYLSRAHKFDNFIKNHLLISKEKYTQKTISDASLPYDTILCESDVIWSTKRGKFDPVFFLSSPSMQNMKRIAYAPSMADARFSTEEENQLDVLLKNVHYISCRESFQKPLLERHTDQTVQHVVDPVMLLDAEDYEPITAPRILSHDYLLLYLPVDDNPDLRKNAIEYASAHNLKILEISTMLKNENNDLETCLPDAGIEEFLSAIKYADMVFTNSFHAICFSIIFSTPFYAFTRKLNGKVYDICDFFGLTNYYMSKDVFIEQPSMDMEAVHHTFKKLQAEGRDWLEHALNDELSAPQTEDYDAGAIRNMYDNTSFFPQLHRVSKKLLKRFKKKNVNILKKIKRKTKKIIRKIAKKLRIYKPAKKIIKNIKRNYDDLKWNHISNRVRNKTAIQENEIVVMTITDSFNCNPKYICQEILQRKLPYKITWLVDKTTDLSVFPDEIHTVYKNSLEALEKISSAKLWLDNGICFSEKYEKKPEQYHVQTMHGSLGIKRLNNSISSRNKTKHGREIIRRESFNTNYILTNSQFEEDVFNTVFWKDVPMHRIGHARTDILFSKDSDQISQIRDRLFQQYGIPVDKKIILYAPTHRKGLTVDDLHIDYIDFTAKLQEKYGEQYVVLLRIHKKTKKIILKELVWTPELREILFDVTSYPDIQELMLVTDIGITDYSSWIFDYVNSRKPGFIFATDLEKYNNVTGLYYPLEETPFPVATSYEELLQNALNFNQEVYLDKVEKFLSEKAAVDDGHSAARAVDLISYLMDSH